MLYVYHIRGKPYPYTSILTPVNIGHTQPVSPPPLHTVERLIRHVEKIPVLVPVARDVMADALRDGHTESALCIALFYLKRHHILPQLPPRARRLPPRSFHCK